MASLEEILSELEVVVRNRKALEAEEDRLKSYILTAHRLLQPDKQQFTYRWQALVVQVRRRTNTVIHDASVLKALLKDKWGRVLKPDPKKTMGVLAQDPDLMARVLASGCLSVTATEYVSAGLGEEPQEEAVILGAEQPSDAVPDRAH